MRELRHRAHPKVGLKRFPQIGYRHFFLVTSVFEERFVEQGGPRTPNPVSPRSLVTLSPRLSANTAHVSVIRGIRRLHWVYIVSGHAPEPGERPRTAGTAVGARARRSKRAQSVARHCCQLRSPNLAKCPHPATSHARGSTACSVAGVVRVNDDIPPESPRTRSAAHGVLRSTVKRMGAKHAISSRETRSVHSWPHERHGLRRL